MHSGSGGAAPQRSQCQSNSLHCTTALSEAPIDRATSWAPRFHYDTDAMLYSDRETLQIAVARPVFAVAGPGLAAANSFSSDHRQLTGVIYPSTRYTRRRSQDVSMSKRSPYSTMTSGNRRYVSVLYWRALYRQCPGF